MIFEVKAFDDEKKKKCSLTDQVCFSTGIKLKETFEYVETRVCVVVTTDGGE